MGGGPKVHIFYTYIYEVLSASLILRKGIGSTPESPIKLHGFVISYSIIVGSVFVAWKWMKMAQSDIWKWSLGGYLHERNFWRDLIFGFGVLSQFGVDIRPRCEQDISFNPALSFTASTPADMSMCSCLAITSKLQTTKTQRVENR